MLGRRERFVVTPEQQQGLDAGAERARQFRAVAHALERGDGLRVQIDCALVVAADRQSVGRRPQGERAKMLVADATRHSIRALGEGQ